jgi:aryl-alcohol dehydrogenase-like predicted oxidoreductase
MKPRHLGPCTVNPLGLGCMNLSHAYGTPPPAEDAEALLRRALELGVDCFDTATMYGAGSNETLVGRVLKPHRSRITLCSKGGLAMERQADGTLKRTIDGRPATLRRHVEASLQRLDTDVIDLYYLHRYDKTVPVEESVGELGRLVAEGKLRAIGLSEVSAVTVRRAHAVHPVAAVQNEYSLWTRNPEIALRDTCRDIGATLVAFSPLARGFLTDTLHDVSTLAEKDLRRGMPRFVPETYAANLKLLPPYVALAREVGCTPAQLALAWVLAQGEHVIAIPGTANLAHLEENMGTGRVELTARQLQRVDALINHATVVGPRYSPVSQADVDSELFPDGR